MDVLSQITGTFHVALKIEVFGRTSKGCFCLEHTIQDVKSNGLSDTYYIGYL